MHTTTRHRLAALALSLAAPALHAEPAPGAVDLRWRPATGQVVVYELTQKSTSSTTAQRGDPEPKRGQKNKRGSKPAAASPTTEVDSTIDQRLTLRLTVVDHDPEQGGTVRLTIERVRATIKAAGTTTTVDSDKPAQKGGDDPVTAALRAIAGTTLTLTVDAQGRITGSEGGGDTLGLAGLLGGAGAGLPTDALGLITPGEGTPYPANVGQRWTSTSTLAGSLLGDIALTTRHTLDRVRANIATVSMVGSMEPLKGDRGSQDQSPFRVVSASNKGAYTWDTQSGWLDSMTVTQSVRTEADLLGEKHTMESATDTTVTRVQKPAHAPEKPAISPG